MNAEPAVPADIRGPTRLAYRRGFEAGAQGLPETSCPYQPTTTGRFGFSGVFTRHNPFYRVWMRGHAAGVWHARGHE